MAGQMMKGIDFGYDLGFCQTGLTLGKTEYVGSDGNLDKYSCFSEKTTIRPARGQAVSLIYYCYTPDHAYYAGDGFFKNMNIAGPGFMQPVQIVSMEYKGAVTKFITIGAEAASSIKKSDDMVTPTPSIQDKMAYDFNVTGRIPHTAVSLDGSYSKTGSDFVNNTLPLSLSGTEQYKVGGKDDFFRSFLTLGIDYNYLIQRNFSIRSSSTKWGFDVRTNSKRYPNVALSYKPFTTFRAATDTFAVPQHPLLGSVWTGKASWQIKSHGRSIRFLALVNKSLTTSDTLRYGANLEQLSAIYSDKTITGSVTIGYSQLSGTSTGVIPTSPNKMSFINVTGGYNLSKQLNISGGQDFGIAGFGFCRYGLSGGVMFRPEQYPVTIRMNVRFTDYELNAGESWRQLIGCNVDMAYRFKMKKK